MAGSSEHSGVLLLADISGYTEFVTGTEIDHSTEILTSLINELLSQIKPPLKVQEIEGDAVFCYVPDAALERGGLLVDIIDATYDAFRSVLDELARQCTCTCRACASAPDLDLKFVVHHGVFARRPTPGHEGISGPDVILVHRLLKNRVRESTGCGAYALFTESAVKALALDELTAGMAAHEERYEHLGDVRGWVYDVGAQRARAHASREVKVAPEGAFLTLSAEVPAPPAIAWEYYANPRHRQHWFQADQWILEGASAGRRGTGTIEHCVHGKEHSIIRTLDWKPMNYATQAFDLPFGGRMMCTTSFEATEEGTRLTVIFGRPEHERPLGRAALGVMMTLLGKSLRRDLATRVQALFGLIRAAGASELTPAEMSSPA